MNESALIELVNAQAGALHRGENLDDWLLAQYPELAPEGLAEATSLFQLATRLKAALLPMAPAASFRNQLLGDLLEEEMAEIYIRPPAYRPGMAWLLVAAAGSLVSFFGLIVLVLRRLRNGSRQDAQPAATTV